MKILRITLENIASLAGVHTVDFTKEPLQSAGLYAISGDTGSGKSSLLDAMCLALYGRTPRLKGGRDSLEKINEQEGQLDPRSLLRRGTAEGMTEVAFVGVDNLPWTARWSVRRSRKNVSGKLQDVSRTLFEGHIAPQGDGPIESGGKKTEVEAAIEEKLGLTFDQFTRAVLLAQNEFAVFLQSNDKDRAEILQALTGTGRFEEISRAVFERSREERNRLKELQVGLDGGEVLSDEARSEMMAARDAVSQQQEQLQTQQKLLEKEQEWHQERGKHQIAMKVAEDALAEARKKRDDNQSRRQQLQLTEQTLRQAAPLHAAANQAELDFEKCSHQLESAVQRKQDAVKVHLEAADALTTAEDKLKSENRLAEELQPKLLQAARIQQQLDDQKTTVDKTTRALSQATQQHEEAKQQLQTVVDQLQQAAAEKKELQSKQQALKHFQPFAKEKSLWIDRIRKASEVRIRCEDANAALQKLETELKEYRQRQAQTKKGLEEASRKVAEAALQLQQAEQEAQKHDRTELNLQRDQLLTKRDHWNQCLLFIQQIQEADEDLNACVRKRQETKASLETRQESLRQLVGTELPAAGQILADRQASLQTVQAAISDEAVRLRTQLKNDQPCAVCGSLEHPFAQEPPSADEAAVATLQKLVREAQEKATAAIQRRSTLDAEIDSLQIRLQEEQQEQERLEQNQARLNAEFSETPEFGELKELKGSEQKTKSHRQLEEIERKLQEVRNSEQQAIEADQLVARSRQILDRLRSEEAETREKAMTAQQQLSASETEHRHQQKHLSDSKIELQNQMVPLQTLFASIPEGQAQFETDAGEFQNRFTEAVSEISQIDQHLEELDTRINSANDRKHTLQPIADSANRQKTERQREHDEATQKVAELQTQLTQLFPNSTPEEAKSLTAKRIADADQQKGDCLQNRSDAEKGLVSATEQWNSADRQYQVADQKRKSTAAAFRSWRESFNEEHHLSLTEEDVRAMLERDEEWLKSEEEALDAMDSDVQTKTGRWETLQSQYDQMLKSRPSERSLGTIQLELAALVSEIAEAQAKKEQLQKELVVDDSQREKNQHLRSQLEVQEKRAEPWVKLNEVIGSADGSVFRNIAQRHTLDILLTFANHQLGLLSGRYRLERIGKSLNLLVVDQEMADERRSVHSLSGGESFLVSLALALGLASLTSNRMKIESLFIDEGFGSLDPNTLDLAMNALVQLESQGRKVGVISHITTMTDAIPVQIRVARGRSGASTVQVPESSNIRKRHLEASDVPRIQGRLFAFDDSSDDEVLP